MTFMQDFFVASRKPTLFLALLFFCCPLVNSSMSYADEPDLQVTPTQEGKTDSAMKKTFVAKKKKTNAIAQSAQKNTAQSQQSGKKSSFFAEDEKDNSAKKNDYVVRRNPSGVDVKKGRYGLGVTPQIKSGPNQNRGGVFGTFSLEF